MAVFGNCKFWRQRRMVLHSVSLWPRGAWALVLVLGWGLVPSSLGGCIAPPYPGGIDRRSSGEGKAPRRAHVVTATAPSAKERYCAWYGEPRGDVLYFGQAAFWASSRKSGGDPTADLRHPGPRPVGRFDLAREVMLEPLEAGVPGSRSGVWDVLPRPDGSVLFTTFFEEAGRVGPQRRGEAGQGRALQRLFELGTGLNELAPGPEGGILVSRYADSRGRGGAVLHLDGRGRLLAEWVLEEPPGYVPAPKTVAWDPSRDEIWVTTDMLPREGTGEPLHDAYVIDRRSGAQRRLEGPEIQFVRFGQDGTGYRAERDGRTLRLRIVPPPDAAQPERSVVLDPAFPADVDFAQDIQLARDGSALVTRWSGWVHRVDAEGRARALRLPRLDPKGLYYTAVLREGRVCATHCADVTVVCVDAP